jgi:glycosyltransferase involved in cell wall biosynthesis
MKILHVISSLDPKFGGPPSVAARLAAAQASLGHEVHLLAYGGDEESLQRVSRQLARVPHGELFQRHLLPRPDRMELLTGKRAGAELATLLPGTGWVHIHGVWETLLKAAAGMAYKRKIPYCFRPAGMLDPWSLRQKKWKKKLAMAMGTRRALGRAAFIHTLNSDEAALIEPLKLGAPCIVLPNGVFLDEIDPLPARGSFRKKFERVGDHRLVLFLSRLHYKKGQDYLADAFALVAEKFPDVHLVVAGPDEGAQADFEKQIAAHHLTHRVHLPGGLYGVDKFAALVDSSCFCLPTRQEGFSVAVLEALASSTPVVISPECHFPEVEEVGAGLIAELNAASVAENLEKILGNPQAGQAMGAAARKLIERDYLWEKIAERAIELYRNPPGRG